MGGGGWQKKCNLQPPTKPPLPIPLLYAKKVLPSEVALSGLCRPGAASPTPTPPRPPPRPFPCQIRRLQIVFVSGFATRHTAVFPFTGSTVERGGDRPGGGWRRRSPRRPERGCGAAGAAPPLPRRGQEQWAAASQKKTGRTVFFARRSQAIRQLLLLLSSGDHFRRASLALAGALQLSGTQAKLVPV